MSDDIDFDAGLHRRVESIPVGGDQGVLNFLGDCVQNAFGAFANEKVLRLLNHLQTTKPETNFSNFFLILHVSLILIKKIMRKEAYLFQHALSLCHVQ